MSNAGLEILYEDNHLLAINKPAGLATMGVAADAPSVVTLAKQYIKQKYRKPGAVYLGIVSRLDTPTTGIVLLARHLESRQPIGPAISRARRGQDLLGDRRRKARAAAGRTDRLGRQGRGPAADGRLRPVGRQRQRGPFAISPTAQSTTARCWRSTCSADANTRFACNCRREDIPSGARQSMAAARNSPTGSRCTLGDW